MLKQIYIHKKRLCFIAITLAAVLILLIFLVLHLRQDTTRLDGNYIFKKRYTYPRTVPN